MTKVKRMDAPSGTPATDTLAHTVRETLRSVGVPTEPLRIVQPRAIPTAPQGPSSARFHTEVYGPDRYDRHASFDAFGAA